MNGGSWRNLTSCPVKRTLCFQDSDSQQTISPIHIWLGGWRRNLTLYPCEYLSFSKRSWTTVQDIIHTWRIVRVTLPRPFQVPIAFQAMPLLQRFSNPYGGRHRSCLWDPYESQLFSKECRCSTGLPSIFSDSHYRIVKEHKKTSGYSPEVGGFRFRLPLSSGSLGFIWTLWEAIGYDCKSSNRQYAIAKFIT